MRCAFTLDSFITSICTASAVLFSLPPPSNFAKIHTRVGRGRLEASFGDLIPPRGTPGVPGAGLPGLGAVPGWRPARTAAQKAFFKSPFAHVLGSAAGWFCKIGG